MVGWVAALMAAFAGALGGIVNALMTDNGFIVPRAVSTTAGGTIWTPGVVGNVIIGAVAAVVSWALYSSDASAPIFSPVHVTLSWAGFASAILVGVGGARWLSSEVDKRLLRTAAVEAANKPANQNLAASLATLAPAAALAAVRT